MTAIDWSAMTPREAYDALRAAPKVAGEWVDYDGGDIAARVSASERVIARVGVLCDGLWASMADGVAIRPAHPTRESAMAAADEELRRRGWLLVDDAKGGG